MPGWDKDEFREGFFTNRIVCLFIRLIEIELWHLHEMGSFHDVH